MNLDSKKHVRFHPCTSHNKLKNAIHILIRPELHSTLTRWINCFYLYWRIIYKLISQSNKISFTISRRELFWISFLKNGMERSCKHKNVFNAYSISQQAYIPTFTLFVTFLFLLEFFALFNRVRTGAYF